MEEFEKSKKKKKGEMMECKHRWHVLKTWMICNANGNTTGEFDVIWICDKCLKTKNTEPPKKR